MRLYLLLRVVAGGAVLAGVLSGCGGSQSGTPSSAASPSGPNPTGSTTQPGVPVRHTHAELEAALPAQGAELHGGALRHRCSFGERCKNKSTKDGAVVEIRYRKQRRDIDPRSYAVMSVFTLDPAKADQATDPCRSGRVSVPLKETSATTYNPGQEGRQRRTMIATHGWSGYVCDRWITFVMDDGRRLPRQHWRQVTLGDGTHRLTVYGGPLSVARPLAEEYLDRLAAE